MGGMKALRRTASLLAQLAASSRVLDLLERSDGEDRQMLRVVTYHRILEPGDGTAYPGVVSATPAGFARQVAALASRFRAISLEEAVSALQGRSSRPPRALLFTFDDAYPDFAEHAWPVLRGHGIPAVLFVPTAFPDRPDRVFWWDRLYRAFARARSADTLPGVAGRLRLRTPAERERSFRKLRDRVKALPHREAMELVGRVCRALEPSPGVGAVLGWDELRSLASEGVALCAHTRTHPLLDRISPDEVRAEVEGSLVDLRREIGTIQPALAYPGGHYDRTALRIVRELGIEVAFTTHRGLNDLRSVDPLQLRRVPVGRRTTNALLRTQLLRMAALTGPPRLASPHHRDSGLRTRPAET
jgi:peptidoglycan/xylan/chitin deacetylase (PgdA/CDA1 family)